MSGERTMDWRLMRTPIEREDDVVAVRQRARVVAERLGMSRQVQTGLATAVSEIARNAYGYAGGGMAEFGVSEASGGQALVVRITDTGPGIADLRTILDGRYVSRTGMGLGIVGARRLVDDFDIASTPGKGTAVTLAKRLRDRRLEARDVAALSEALVRDRDADPQEAVRAQNRDLVQSLADLAEKEEEARRLNDELREARDNLERRVEVRTAELAEANARLRQEAVERERMQSELRQAQKMEAVGQLTGGLAHDFNNQLTGITGSLDLLRTRLAQGRTDRIDRYLDTAMTSARKAAVLTHRLLAFSRPQPLAPRSTDVNAVVRDMEELLRRTITDAIALRVSASLDLWPTLCDAHQFENAVLNLCINARDAMPDGGTLAIETANERLEAAYAARHPAASPGDHVRVCVEDTGTGMSPEVVARVFEPFFTTKPVGKGTGLGMAMIYGFARQSGGHCRIETELGRGTRVFLYMPRHVPPADPDEEGTTERPAIAAMPPVTVGTILLVEQNVTVRDLALEVLRDLGHHVILAEDGPAALRRMEAGDLVDLIVTDIGLPGGMTGPQVAEGARAMRPGVKVLFVTGYADEAEAAATPVAPGVEVMPKPFEVADLVERVGKLLGGSAV